MFGDSLEQVAALASLADLTAWRRNREGDLALFLDVAEDLGLERMGRATDVFLSYGAYEETQGQLFIPGLWQAAQHHVLAPQAIAEDLSHAWLAGDAAPPAQGQTIPQADKPGAYTWCKAPRYHGVVAETGALARQMVTGHPLVRDLVRLHGGSVMARVLARLLELALVLPRMQVWARQLQPRAPWCHHADAPREGTAAGLVEAARGALGHWLTVKQGRIANYQIIAPTTWNFSPRDAQGTPGALEQALAHLPVSADQDPPLLVQHVVRSFDPCMVCTVH